MSKELSSQTTRVPGQLHDAQFEVGVIPPAGRRCQNCQTPMQGPYCFQCGQHEKSSVRHLGLFIRDIIDDVLNLDSRAVRTIKPLLFSPGFLTKEYLQGRRMRYVPPLRLYVIASLVFFFVLGTVVPNEVFKITFDNINADSADEIAQSLVEMQKAPEFEEIRNDEKFLPLLELAKQQQNWTPEEREKFARDMRSYVKATQTQAFSRAIEQVAKAAQEMDEQEAERAQAELEAEQDGSEPGGQSTHQQNSRQRVEEANKKLQRLNTELAKAEQMSDSALLTPPTPPAEPDVPAPRSQRGRIQFFSGLDKSSLPWLHSIEERVNKRWDELRDQPEQIRDNIFRLLPQSMFIMLPLFALVLKLFFPFSNRLYAEHLITAVHSHCFMFFLISLLVTLTYAIDQMGGWHEQLKTVGKIVTIATIVGWFWIPVYLFKMQRTVYGQGIIATSIKFMLIGTMYITLLVFVLAIDFIVSLL